MSLTTDHRQSANTTELMYGHRAREVGAIADDNVAPLHGVPLQQRLLELGLRVDLVVFSAGEASKSRRTKQQLEDRLFELGAGRDAAILAVGGGVTGDLAGFVAATWHRGIPVIQVPTSLIAMADAALANEDAATRRALASAAARQGHVRVLRRVVELLMDEDADVRAEAFSVFLQHRTEPIEGYDPRGGEAERRAIYERVKRSLE